MGAAANVMTARLLADGPHLSVGILTANLGTLDQEHALLERTGVTLVHTDVMDGVFCPMFTVGPPFVAAQRTRLVKDVHLMIRDPLERVAAFVAAGADMITFHVESAPNPHRVLQALGDAENLNDPARGIVRGVAVSPGTPLEVLEPLIDDLEYILVLAINPGWGDQRFLPGTARRLERVRSMVAAARRPILVGVDGGITKANVATVAALGPDVIVSGSAIFDGTPAAEENARWMLAAIGRPDPGAAS
jgi:ribulose-phosphate 3-epimerase